MRQMVADFFEKMVDGNYHELLRLFAIARVANFKDFELSGGLYEELMDGILYPF
jgi:hypothetical protein